MLSDMRWVVRRLRRRLGFSLVFVGILGVVLGITLTVGTLTNATIGTALPYEDESSLYVLSETQQEQGIDRMVSSLAAVEDWQSRTRVFASLGAVRTQLNLTLEQPDGVVRIAGAIVSRSMFDVLRVELALGRGFAADEDQSGAGIPVVMRSIDDQSVFYTYNNAVLIVALHSIDHLIRA